MANLWVNIDKEEEVNDMSFINKPFLEIKKAKTDQEILVILAGVYDEAFRYGYQDGYHKRDVSRYLEK